MIYDDSSSPGPSYTSLQQDTTVGVDYTLTQAVDYFLTQGL